MRWFVRFVLVAIGLLLFVIGVYLDRIIMTLIFASVLLAHKTQAMLWGLLAPLIALAITVIAMQAAYT